MSELEQCIFGIGALTLIYLISLGAISFIKSLDAFLLKRNSEHRSRIADINYAEFLSIEKSYRDLIKYRNEIDMRLSKIDE